MNFIYFMILVIGLTSYSPVQALPKQEVSRRLELLEKKFEALSKRVASQTAAKDSKFIECTLTSYNRSAYGSGETLEEAKSAAIQDCKSQPIPASDCKEEKLSCK